MGDSAHVGGSAMAELHLKMSKKIAQLTKVIFHLNTRNEDFQSEVAHHKKAHTYELQRLAQDAAFKLHTLQEQLQTQTQAAAHWERACVSDKQQFQNEFALYQQKTRATQSANELAFQHKITQMEEQVATCQRAFMERIQELMQTAEAQQQKASYSAFEATAALQSAHERELQELREKQNDEVTQLVTASNAKYNQMLADQLRLQDDLKDELTKAKARLEQQLTALQGESAAQLAAREHAAKESLDQMRHQLVSKMETLLAESELLRGNEAKVRQEKESLLQTQSELQRQLKALELQVAKAQQEAQSVRKDADANVQTLQHMLSVGTEKIDQLAQELETLKKTLQTRDHALRQAQKDLEAAQLETLQRSMNLSERDAAHNQQLQEKALEAANMKAELQTVSQQKTLLESTLQAKIQTLYAQVAEKDKELSDLQTKLAASELQRSQLVMGMDALRDSKKQTSDRNDRKVAELVQSHEKALRDLKSVHAAELVQQKRDVNAKLVDLETQMKQLTSASLETTIAKLTGEHAKALSAQKVEFDALEAGLKQELAQVQAQLTAVQVDVAQKVKELAELRAKATELTAQLKATQDRVSALQNESEKLQKGAEKARKDKEDALQKQISELTTQNRTAMQKLIAEKEHLQLQHSQTLKALAKEHEFRLKTLQSDSEAQKEAQLATQMSQLTDHFEQQLARLSEEFNNMKKQLEQTNQDAQEMQRSMNETRLYEQESYRSAFARQIAQLQADKQREADDMRQQMEATMRQHAKELEALTQRLNNEKQALLKNVEENAECRMAQLKAGHREKLETTKQQHALVTKDLRESMEAMHTCQVLALRTENTQKMRDLTAQKDRERAEALEEAQDRHDTAFGTLQKQAELLQSALTQKTIDFNASCREIERLSAALDAKTRELAERVTSLERTNREHIEMLKKAAKQDMDHLLEENLAEMKLLSNQFEEMKRLMTDKVLFLKQTIAEWEDRYARRESRLEDVSRIADLERAVIEREALVKQTLDEMAYFKRELLNREEMYNKTFARTPNVGVMNVLKPHVQLQQQMQMQSNNMAPQMKRKTKPSTTGAAFANSPELQGEAELHRRNSERGSSSSGAAVKKSLPPLNNNQFVM